MASEMATKIAALIRQRRTASDGEDVALMRAGMLRAALPPPDGVHVEARTLGTRRVLLATAPGSAADCALLYLHGGAYVAGAPESHLGLIGELALRARIPVWALDYRLAPEHPYPAALDDARAAHAALLAQGLDAGRIAIGGDSAGGGLAFATALSLVERGQPQPAALLALSPWLDLRCQSDSWRERGDQEVMLSKDNLDRQARRYAGDHDLATPSLSPLLADAAALAKLPPTLLQVGSAEVLLDDAVQMHRALCGAEASVQLQVFDELFHVFQAVTFLPEARDANASSAAFLRERLGLGA